MKNVLLTINEMAERTGVHPQTLRNWEKSGVLKPSEKIGKRKLFTEEQIEEVANIKNLKNEGYRLKGIKNMKNEKNNKTKKETKAKVNYSELSIDELTELAKNKNIKYFRQMFKNELVEALSHPRNAQAMSEQAKIRTKERYGNKQYGKNVMVAASPLETNIKKSGINSNKGLVSKNEQLVSQIIDLYQNGKTIKQIAKTLK